MSVVLRVCLCLVASVGFAAAARATDEEIDAVAAVAAAEEDLAEQEAEEAEEGAEEADAEAKGEDADADAGPASYTRDGWYVAASWVNGFENFATTPFEVRDSWGVSGRLGFRFLELAALEFQYERMFEFELRSPPDGIDFQVNVFSANARGYLPLWRLGGIAERLHPYTLAGIGLHQVDVDDHGAPYGEFSSGEKGAFAMRFGGGIDVYVTDQLVLFQETTYELPTERDNHDMQYVSISWGLQWRFLPEER